MTRATTSAAAAGAAPQAAEAAANSTRPDMNTRRAPIRSPSAPAGRSRAANTIVYASTTHCRALTPPPRSRPIGGSATLTIVASRMTMK